MPHSTASSVSSTSSSEYDKTIGDEFMLQCLIKKYFLIDKIGAGTFSGVWLAVNMKTSKLYAIKIQHINDYYDGEKEAIFLTKIKKFKNTSGKEVELNLPNIIEYFEVKNPEQPDYLNLCIVMDLCFSSIAHLLKMEQYENGFEFNVCNKIITDTLNGLNILYKMGYIHTDIKPENILIKGLNPIFIEFEKYINDNNIFPTISEKLHTLYTSFHLHKLPSNSLLYKNNKKQYSIEKQKFIQQQLILLVKQFKQISNNYIDNIDDIDHSLEPNYYSKTFDFSSFNFHLLDYTFILSDFGTIKSIIRDNSDEIQTRYYRAPEVIIGCKWDYKADIWSIGCLYFELLTNDVLFNPENDEKYDTDTHHLYWIQQLIDIDVSQYGCGKYFNKYFDNNKLKCITTDFQKLSFAELLSDISLYDGNVKTFILQFLQKTICNVNERSSFEQLFNYFIKSSEIQH